MRDKLVQIAAGVIARANREQPADAVLRLALKETGGISREDGGVISRAVFAYYRWLGWVGAETTVERRLQRALELNRTFQSDSTGIPEAELGRAIPDWVKGHVEVSLPWLRALQNEPTLWLRARPGQAAGLMERLNDCGRVGTGRMAEAVRYFGEKDLFRTPEFHDGGFEVQDISSQVVGVLCDPQPGETWWDACAGEGGKTLLLSDLMRNQGLLWASDRAEWRLQRLKRRTARAKVFNYRAASWNGGARLPTKTKFDGILVDAPCSGMGTWQRNPHARWTTSAQDVRELSAVQKTLLRNVAPALKPGGRLVYSVCSLTGAETSGVAEAITREFAELRPLFLANPLRPETASKPELRLWPQEAEGIGMFICGWERPGG